MELVLLAATLVSALALAATVVVGTREKEQKSAGEELA